MKRFRISIRELLLLMVIGALAFALVFVLTAEEEPVYLHVFGTMVSLQHDIDRPKDSPLNPGNDPWTRIATVQVFDGRPFGMLTPNDRQPSVGIDGKLSHTFDDRYRGNLHFWLDDANLTHDVAASVNLELDRVVYIDDYYNCYLISRSDDPYEALSNAFQKNSP